MFTGRQPERTLRILNNEINPQAYASGNRSTNIINVNKQPKKIATISGKQKMNLAADHIDIVALGEGDPTSIMKRMKMIEEQFMQNPQYHEPSLTRKKETKPEEDATLG